MENKTQKTALNESIMAEEHKVTVEKPAVKAKAEKKRAAKPAEKSVARKKTASGKIEKTPKKQKVIRDSFSMPESDYSLIAVLKKQCVESGMAVKKSELLRAGIKALKDMNQASLNKHLSELVSIKTGRPAKAKESRAK